jgi:hypothetical protein
MTTIETAVPTALAIMTSMREYPRLEETGLLAFMGGLPIP